MSSIWKKILGDFKVYKGRFIIMIIALTITLLAVMTLLTNFSIISREIGLKYMSTQPAHITLELDESTADLARQVEQLDYVESAEARGFALVRVKNPGGGWYPLKLFVVQDFEDLSVASFKANSGAWPASQGEI
ncbi:MAG: hypothetical protein PF447_11315, partial [Spirochaetaceae bacterium]|nr:hypothetical protein [Spirochaetaceae bacterium]